MTMQATVISDRERTETDKFIQIMTPTEIIFLNPEKKEAVVSPVGKRPEAGKGQKLEMFVDKKQSGDLTHVTVGMKTPDGKKLWIAKVQCRPDGIFVERQIRTPKGVVTFRQTDIKPGDVSEQAFVVPADYTVKKSESAPVKLP